MKDTCTHTKPIEGHWVDRPNFDQEEYDCGGFEYEKSEWVDGYDDNTYEDVDVHHYKCTQCGKIFNY